MSAGREAAIDADRRRRTAGIAVSVALVLLALALATQGDDSGGQATPVDALPQIVDVSDLEAFEDSLGHPLYWAGELSGRRLELKEEGGNVYIRYLPAGVKAGAAADQFLTVGTYPVGDAAAALRRTAAKEGVKVSRAPDGGTVLVNPSSPSSVYLAEPGSDLQIEVYDPVPGRALRLIRSGAIETVG